VQSAPETHQVQFGQWEEIGKMTKEEEAKHAKTLK
jgi:hypothetical protein